MTYVALRPNGQVTLLRLDGSEHDVSNSAGEYLFHQVLLEEGVLLRDVFQMLQRNPLLLQVFRPFYAEELVKEALSEGAPPVPAYGPENIEYLELARFCMTDHETHTYESQFLMLSGIGFALREPLETELQVFPVGSRQDWSISLTPIFELANYPLRFNDEVEFRDPPLVARDAGRQPGLSGKFKFGPPTLGQVVHGVLHELTFFGVGDARTQFQEGILDAQIAGDAKEVSSDDLIAQLDEMLRQRRAH